MLTFCVEWNEIAIRICRGAQCSYHKPSGYCQYLRYNPQNFLGKKRRICWSGRPKILADCTPGQKYKRLKIKGWKMQLCLNPHVIAKNGQKNSIFFSCLILRCQLDFQWLLHFLPPFVLVLVYFLADPLLHHFLPQMKKP